MVNGVTLTARIVPERLSDDVVTTVSVGWCPRVVSFAQNAPQQRVGDPVADLFGVGRTIWLEPLRGPVERTEKGKHSNLQVQPSAEVAARHPVAHERPVEVLVAL